MLFYISTLENSEADKTISKVTQSNRNWMIFLKGITEQNTSNFATILENKTQNFFRYSFLIFLLSTYFIYY